MTPTIGQFDMLLMYDLTNRYYSETLYAVQNLSLYKEHLKPKLVGSKTNHD